MHLSTAAVDIGERRTISLDWRFALRTPFVASESQSLIIINCLMLIISRRSLIISYQLNQSWRLSNFQTLFWCLVKALKFQVASISAAQFQIQIVHQSAS